MSMSPGTIWRVGSAFGVAAIGLGAFGAHGLKSSSRQVSEQSLKNWSTASEYLLIHGVVLLGISMHPRFSRHKATASLMTAGTILFSGSLYGLILTSSTTPHGGSGVRKVLGPLTPLGGLFLIAGWTTMLF